MLHSRLSKRVLFETESKRFTHHVGLRDIFMHTTSVWCSFFEPVGPSFLPPWNMADKTAAETIVVPCFIDLLNWLPHSTYLAPGSESLETLFWRYFLKKLLGIQKAGSSHIFVAYVGFHLFIPSQPFSGKPILSSLLVSFLAKSSGFICNGTSIRIVSRSWPADH